MFHLFTLKTCYRHMFHILELLYSETLPSAVKKQMSTLLVAMHIHSTQTKMEA